VADLRGRAVNTAPQITIENYSPADAGAERQTNDRLATNRRAAPHLTDGGGVRIVFEKRGDVQLFGESGSETKAIETREVWGGYDRAFFDFDGAGYD
jgi:hypothetical protein